MQKFARANINKVYLFGSVKTIPTFSHSVFGQDFYQFELEVKRLSGYLDILPITISNNIVSDISENRNIGIVGQLRSYNIITDNMNHLMLTVFAKKILQESFDDAFSNEIHLEGYICKPPIYRITPFKREICDLLIAANRSYGKSDYSNNCLGQKCIPVERI